MQGDFRLTVLPLALAVDHLRVQRLFIFINIFDEFDDAAVILHDLLLPLAAFIGQGDLNPFIEEGLLTQTCLLYTSRCV